MIMTSREADPLIVQAARTEKVISDDVAQTIASWWHSPMAPDSPITRVSHGRAFDPSAAVAAGRGADRDRERRWR